MIKKEADRGYRSPSVYIQLNWHAQIKSNEVVREKLWYVTLRCENRERTEGR